MAEPAPARRETATTDVITVTWSQTSGYGISPQDSDADGTVQVLCGRACWIWTWVNGVPVNAFNGETNNNLPCSAGGNNIFTPNEPVGTIITFVPTDPNSNPPPPPTRPSAEGVVAGVKGTIKITSSQQK
jgi:hypothetical protein